MTADRYRRLALALDDVIEAEHMGHPDFRVGGRIFATLQPGLRTAAVTLTLADQAQFVADAPDVFAPEVGAWGAAGATRIQLAPAGEDLVGQALTLAWQLRRAKNAASKSKPRAGAVSRITKKASRPRVAVKPAKKR